jgi:hypothetical protein
MVGAYGLKAKTDLAPLSILHCRLSSREYARERLVTQYVVAILPKEGEAISLFHPLRK